MIDKDQSFEQFTMNCARAFGALISMRDDASDAPIPDEIVPDKYYAESLKEAQDELMKLSAMSAGELREYGAQRKLASIASWENSVKDEQSDIDKCRAMLERVRAWTPPTADHEGLKNFMVQQISDSMKYADEPDDSYRIKALREAQQKTPEEYAHEAMADARERVTSREKDLLKEQQRCAERTQWIRDLRKSLSPV